jgi:uncharacterized protein (DUF697 family)
MIKTARQVRAALSLLNPAEIRRRSTQQVVVGLVAENEGAYRELEEFLIPETSPAAARSLESVYRAGGGGEAQVDLVLYSEGLPCPRGAFQHRHDDPDSTLAEILRHHDDLSLPLARQFPAFRKPVVEKIVHNVSLENASFALATALPNVVPNLLELPWVIGEFASDTAFLTMNQMRMAFLIAAASGAEVGLGNQKAEMMTIVAGGFGWRAIARELAGKIPLGGGLIPKAAIAYAGTYVVGKGLERFHHAKQRYTKAESDEAYRAAFHRGKALAESFRRETP